MPWIIGSLLAAGVAIFARISGFDRGRAFYSTILIIVGSYYVLFATMAGAGILPEVLGFAVFAALAVIGFRFSLWIVAAGLALHGAFDFIRASAFPGSGAPAWWPAFCGSYDIVAAVVLAGLVIGDRSKVSAGFEP